MSGKLYIYISGFACEDRSDLQRAPGHVGECQRTDHDPQLNGANIGDAGQRAGVTPGRALRDLLDRLIRLEKVVLELFDALPHTPCNSPYHVVFT